MPDLITLADLPELSGDDPSPSTTITVARLDSNLRDPRYGRFGITQADVDGWKRNLAGVFGGRVSIDADHSSDRGKGTKASAWITGLHQDGKKVQASVEFTPAGARQVREKEYLFISPTFVENYKDEHGVSHGKALLGAALTNRPVLREDMPTLSLSREHFDGVAELDRKPGKRQRKAAARERAHARTKLLSLLDDSDVHLLGTLSNADRKKHATIVRTLPNGKKKYLFPQPPGDKVHAEKALQLINTSDLSAAEKAKVRARATATLGKKALSDSRRRMDLRELAKLLDLPEDAENVTILAAVAAMPANAETATDPPVTLSKAERKLAKKARKAERPGHGNGTMALSAGETARLITAANAGQAASVQLAEQTFDTEWTKTLDEGRAAPSQEDTMRALFRENQDLALKTLASFVRVIPTMPAGSGDAGEEALRAPDGVDQGRFQLHQEATARAKTLTQADPQLSADEAYTQAALELDEQHAAQRARGF